MLGRPRLIPALIPEAVAAAVAWFQLRDPVTISVEELPHRECLTDESRELWAYYFREAKQHHIVVHSGLTPQEMSKSIYHELTHASQCEVEFNGDGPAFHTATFQEGARSELSGLGGALEDDAEAAELLDYDLRLVRMVKQWTTQ